MLAEAGQVLRDHPDLDERTGNLGARLKIDRAGTGQTETTGAISARGV